MIPETDRAYIAGLFDGEGSIHFKRGPEKKKKHRGKPGYRISNSLRLSMEVTMTDRSVLMCLHHFQTDSFIINVKSKFILICLDKFFKEKKHAHSTDHTSEKPNTY